MPSLAFPNISHKPEYLSMIAEWKSHEILSSPGSLFRGESFEDFLQLAQEDMTSNRFGVTATLFFLMEGDRILGAIQIRHHIDHPNLIEMGGHIGYGIRPTERGRGYATKMLALALIEARKLGIDRVLITCDDENIASSRVIEKNGGVFDRFGYKDERKGRRYWITL